MIFSTILDLIYYGITLFIGLLPTYTGLPSGLITAINYIFHTVASISDFFPMGTVWTIFFLWVTTEVVFMLVKFLVWSFIGKVIKGGTNVNNTGH